MSEACKDLYPRQYHDKIFVIENASDPDVFNDTELPEEFNVGFISGIAPGRGIDLLIQAMESVREKVPQATLTLAGTPITHYQGGIDYYLT